MDSEMVAGVAGQPQANEINGCDGNYASAEPAKSAENPSGCLTEGTPMEYGGHPEFYLIADTAESLEELAAAKRSEQQEVNLKELAARASGPMPAWQNGRLNLLIKELTHWRNDDYYDELTLSRSDVITILEGLKHARSALATARGE